MVAWILGSVLTLLFVVALFYLGSLRWRGSSADNSAGPAASTAEHATLRAIQQEAATAASLELDRLQARVEELLRRADQLDSLRSEWPPLLDRLLTDEDGRALAGRPENVKAFMTLQRADYAPQTLVADVRRRGTQVLDDIKRARGTPDNAWSPGRTAITPIERDEADIAAAVRVYQDTRQQLLAMIESGRRAGPSPLALQQAIRDVQAEYGEEQARLVAAAKDTAARIVAETLAKSESEKVLAEGDAQRLKVETETQRIREQARVERLRTLASDVNIQEKYSAFLDAGTIVFSMRNDLYFGKERTERKFPASLTQLRQGGHLNSAESFAKVMCGIGPLAANDRRKRADYPRNEDEWKKYEEFYREFIELAPTWVEMGLLLK